MTREDLLSWQQGYLRALTDADPVRRAAYRTELVEAQEAVVDSVLQSKLHTVQRSVETYFPVFAGLCPDFDARLRSVFAAEGIRCDRSAFIDRAHDLLRASVRALANGPALADLLAVERALSLASFHRVGVVGGPGQGAGSAHRYRVELRTNAMERYPEIARLEDLGATAPRSYEIYFAGEEHGVIARRLRASDPIEPTGDGQ